MKASIMISNSMRWSLTGVLTDWTTNTSEPRTDSLMDTEISPSLKVVTLALPTGSPSASAICPASIRLELAEKILMSLP